MTTFALAVGSSPSPAVAVLQAAVLQLAEEPSPYDDELALAEADAILACEQQLKVLAMRRIADVDARRLHEKEGFQSVRSWLRDRRPDGDTTDATLGSSLREFPVLSNAVDTGECSLAASRKVVHVLRQCRRFIDGPCQGPGVTVVVRQVVTLVSRYLLGLEDDDPRLTSLVESCERILTSGAGEFAQLEAAFTLLACQVPLPALTGLLDELLVTLAPEVLERRAAEGQHDAGLDLSLRADGKGWRVQGDLDLECGERLFTALRSEAARDPRNPYDTELWGKAVHLESLEDSPALVRPRDKRRRLHDALDRLLTRYLDAGLGGMTGKAPVQLSVLVPDGPLPPRADSGALIPRAMVRRWWCDSSVTAFVLSLGGKALRTVHAQRTLTARERRALDIETGGRCAGLDCCSDLPPLLSDLIPHHTQRYADHGRTMLSETLGLCKASHRAVHDGKVVRLRDGRYLTEAGISDRPPEPKPPPF
jgi:hypothetical protein